MYVDCICQIILSETRYMYVCVRSRFRGSTGFGQDSIESLPGHIGRNDVDDIVLALRAVVDKFNLDGDEVQSTAV